MMAARGSSGLSEESLLAWLELVEVEWEEWAGCWRLLLLELLLVGTTELPISSSLT